MKRARHARRGARGMTAVEVAVTFALGGSLLAVAVPAFVRNVHASKLVEPADGVKEIAERATAYASGKEHGHGHDIAHAYPPSAPLTPATVARGTREVDPPGAWDHPTWTAIGFRAVDEGVPHAYSFELATTNGATRSTFAAIAHGDLDGDGVTSTFEVKGHDQAGESGPFIDPGMVVQSELE